MQWWQEWKTSGTFHILSFYFFQWRLGRPSLWCMLIAAVSLAVTTAGYYLSLQPRAERGRSHLNEIYQLHYSCKTVYHVSLLALILVTKMESVYCCKYHRADEIGRVRMKSSKRNYGCGAGRFPRDDHRLSLPVLFIYLFIKAVSWTTQKYQSSQNNGGTVRGKSGSQVGRRDVF